ATLPPEVVRCNNCHAREVAGMAPATAALVLISASGVTAEERPDSSESYGPILGSRTLMQRVARRGGPPSVYDAVLLCRVLRDGVDPAHVVIDQTMPRYTVTDAECRALWSFLTAP